MGDITQPSKRTCNHNQCSNEGGLDFISNLHESIIANILSRLHSTESAMRTSVLLRAWKDNWTYIYNVSIDDSELIYRYLTIEAKMTNFTKANFVKFVDTVLFHTKNVTSFSLSFHDEYESSLVKAWISSVLERRHIKTFSLLSIEAAIVLGQDLLGHTSLESLVLEENLTLNLPVTSYFPNLTTLSFRKIKIVNENSSTNTLTLKFPVLKSCTLSICTWLNVKLVEIDAPLLTKFGSWTPWEHGGVDEYSIKIFGARLAMFESGGGLPEDYSIQNISTVVSAVFRNNNGAYLDKELAKSSFKIRSLMKGLPNLEYLKLSDCMAKAITQSRGIVALPRYDKLKRLILRSPAIGEPFEWSSEALFELLHAAPCLKLLAIDGIDWDGYDQDNNNNDAMKSVPRCITNHLEEVKFKYKAYDPTHQFQLEKFLLKNALQLKKFSISVHDGMPKDEIVQRLSAFSKGSACLTIEETKNCMSGL